MSDEKVRVISPSGKAGSIPRANLQKALDSGFKLSDDQEERVRVVSPSGKTGSIPQSKLQDAIDSGFSMVDNAPMADAEASTPNPYAGPEGIPTIQMIGPTGDAIDVPTTRVEDAVRDGYLSPAQRAHQQAVEDSGGRLDQLATYGENTLAGASLGMTAPVAALEGAGKWIGNKLAQHPDAPDVSYGQAYDQAAQEMALRAEANPKAAFAGQATGILGSALASGGAGAFTPTGALSRAGTAIGEKAAAKVSAEAMKGLLQPAVKLAAQGFAEGAVYGSAKPLNDALLTGDYDQLAEKTVAGMAFGAASGALIAPAVGGTFSTVAKAAKNVPKLAAYIDDIAKSDLVGERSFKAALGGRNLKDTQLTKRIGGAADVGKTLLDEGIVTPTSTIEQIAVAAKQKAAEYGQKIDDMYTYLDDVSGGGVDGNKLWKAIDDEILEPLRKRPVLRSTADALEQKLKDVKHYLTASETAPVVVRGSGREARKQISFRDVWALRKDVDQLAKFDRPPTPYGAPPTAMEQAFQETRTVIRNFIEDEGSQIAYAAGRKDFSEAFRALNKRYGQIKHAQGMAEKAIARDEANRFFSPSDYGLGSVIAGAEAVVHGGPSIATLAYGLASGAVHKIARERGSAFIAGTLYGGSKSAAALARKAAIAAQKRVDALPSRFISALKTSTPAATHAAETGAVIKSINLIMREANEIASGAPVSQQNVNQFASEHADDDPKMNNSLSSQLKARAQFLVEKQNAGTDPIKMGRYAAATMHPVSALERIADGNGSMEDIESVQKVYPSMWNEFLSGITADLTEADYETRIRASVHLGLAFDPSMGPESLQFYQSRMAASDAATMRAKGTPDMGASVAPVTGDRVSVMGR